jgi:hypothetical protein
MYRVTGGSHLLLLAVAKTTSIAFKTFSFSRLISHAAARSSGKADQLTNQLPGQLAQED